jgi:hypothetical protein
MKWFDLQPVQIGEVLLLLMLANGAPVIAKKLLGTFFNRPLDGGRSGPDGRPWLGPSKTIRGIAVSLIATTFGAALTGFGWRLGAVVALAAMTGDLASSFFKRRLGMASSSRAIGLDQIPESLLPALASAPMLGLHALDISTIVLVFLVGELALSRLLFRWRIRDRPY